MQRYGIIVVTFLIFCGLYNGAFASDANDDTVKVLKLSAPKLDYVQRNKTGTRDIICLNGIWNWQYVVEKLYCPFTNRDLFPVPNSPYPTPKIDRKPKGPLKDEIRVPNHAPHCNNTKYTKYWYSRKVHVPASWKGRRVELMFMGAGFEVVAYVNGECIGWHLGDTTSFFFEATKAIKFGEENEILLSVWRHRIFYGKVWPQGLVESVFLRRTGVWDDVYLCAAPMIGVENMFCRPSFRKKTLSADVMLRNQTNKPANVEVQCVVLDKDGKDVLMLPTYKVSINADSTKTVTLSKVWLKPHLWTPDDPYLYYLETRVVQDGRIIDVQRERFGFREIWIQGRNFYLNGKIMHFHALTLDMYTGLMWNQNLDWMKAWFRRFKALGYNMVRTFDKPSYIFLEAADEVGMCVKVQSGWHHANTPLTEEFKKNAGQTVREWILRDRNHPSILMWDAANEPDGYYESVFWVVDQIRKLDPTRPVDVDRSFGVAIYDWSGNPKTMDNYNVQRKEYSLSNFEIANTHYPIVCGLSSYSMLRAAEYPARWMTYGNIPLVFGEWGDSDNPGLLPRGPKHYEDLRSLRNFVWQGAEFDPEGWLSYLEDIIPYWRRLGVSGYDEWLSHTTLGWLTAPVGNNGYPVGKNVSVDGVDIPVEWDSLDTPGIKFEKITYPYYNVNPGWFPSLPEFDLDEKWTRYSKIWKPVFAFFPDRVRSVYDGDVFKRNLTLINDTMSNQTLTGEVLLNIDQKPVVKVPFHIAVPQGRGKEIPVSFKLPNVRERTDATVVISLDRKEKDWHAVKLPLILQPHGKTLTKCCIALYDPKGTTERVLQNLGISYQPVENPAILPDGTDVLVIGYNALDEKIVASNSAIRAFAEKGNKVVCLYQDEWRDWLPIKLRRDERLNMPRLWLLAKDHPVLQDILDEDMQWWPNDRGLKFRLPGAVASKPFIKPKSGSVRSLLECGEKLDLSGLLELRLGRGAVYLSQVRAVPVAGTSPAADQYLRNIITSAIPPLPHRRVWFAGNNLERSCLRNRLSIETSDLRQAENHTFDANDLIVWIPGDKPIDSDLDKLVTKACKAGASLLAIAAKPELFPTLPNPPKFGDAVRYGDFVYIMQKESKRDYDNPPGRFIKAAIVDRRQPLADGLSNAEMYRSSQRTSTYKLANLEILPANGWVPLTDPGVIAMRKEGEGVQVLSTVIRFGPTKPTEKYERMLHTLLVNLGAGSKLMHMPKITTAAPVGKFFPVDLRVYCTMGFKDDKPGDGKGGWGDQGPQNDLRMFPLDKPTFLDVPFTIIDPETNDGKSVVVLGSDKLPQLSRKVTNIDFGHRKASRIYFLHSMSWGKKSGLMGKYVIRYGKALQMTETVPLQSGVNIADWFSPDDYEQARVAWADSNAITNVGVYLYVWENPHPDTVIDEIDIISVDKDAILQILAITGQEPDKTTQAEEK